MCWVSGHGEGWALYSKRLMGELGYLDDPGAHLGMLEGQLLLAAQVALDIGVHLELEIPDRSYVNNLTAEDGQKVHEVWGANYRRLVTVKRRHDPDNVFRLNHNIDPST